MQWQARPGVQQAQNFSHDVQCIVRRAPPMVRLKRIAGSAALDGPPAPARNFLPWRAHSPGMCLRRDYKYRGALLALQFGGNDLDVIGAQIAGWRYQYP